ncbi:MAG TPA: hypothetical protein VGF04_05605 [Solirubrobacterales bacterium]|jgi:hypothetical protein
MDIGQSIHYAAVRRGTPVYGADEVEVGRVEAMLDNYREHIFDGVVFSGSDGRLRFVDAPEVARTAENGVLLRIDAEEAARLGPPDKGNPSFRPNLRAGRLGRLFGGGWKRR